MIERLQAELAKHFPGNDHQQIEDASVAGTYGRTDIDIGFVEPVIQRCREVFAPLERDFVAPTFGLTLEQLLSVPEVLKSKIQSRWNQCRRTIANELKVNSEYKDLVEYHSQRQIENIFEFSVEDLPAAWTSLEKEAFFRAMSFSPCDKRGIDAVPIDNITLRKPFLQLTGGRYFLVDPVFFGYAPTRLLYYTVEQSPFRERCLRIRDLVLEKHAGRILAKAVSPQVHLSGVYAPTGKDGALAEHDHIMVANDRLFLVECKANRIRKPELHGGSAVKVQDDIRSGIQVGFDQGNRARDYVMNSSGLISFFDKFGTKVKEIDRSKIKRAHVLVVTWESLGPLGVDLQPWIRIEESVEFPWVIWIDDLKTALTRLRSGTEVGSYIEWRSPLNGRIIAGDEMHVVGCFASGHIELPPGNDNIVIDGSYAEIFDDDFFASHGMMRKTRAADKKPAIVRLSRENGVPTARLKDKVLFGGSQAEESSSSANQKTTRRFKKRRRTN